MTELKTLKDLKNTEEFYTELKQEAIKWIKKIKFDFKLSNKHMPEKIRLDYSNLKLKDIKSKSDGILDYLVDDLPEENHQSGVSIIAFIKYFFNITEEDLMTNEEINKREFGEKGNN